MSIFWLRGTCFYMGISATVLITHLPVVPPRHCFSLFFLWSLNFCCSFFWGTGCGSYWPDADGVCYGQPGELPLLQRHGPVPLDERGVNYPTCHRHHFPACLQERGSSKGGLDATKAQDVWKQVETFFSILSCPTLPNSSHILSLQSF